MAPLRAQHCILTSSVTIETGQKSAKMSAQAIYKQ